MDAQRLKPARDLVRTNKIHFPNEGAAYRKARNDLLTEEIELRRHAERVAELRRALPPGGEVDSYSFTGEQGPASFADLFDGRQTLIIYSYMYGPKREKPCPMCTSFMDTWDLKMPAVEDRVSLIFTARSPIERQLALKKERGWKRLRLFADTDGAFTRNYVNPEDGDTPAYNVFTQRDGVIRHFWAQEMSGDMADPGQDPRGSPELDPLFLLLDTTPEERGADWYPKLTY